MKLEFQDDDVKAIAREVVEILKPYLSASTHVQNDETLFDVKGLAQYLKVSKKWVYDNGSELPHFKIKGCLRFKKSRIDAYLDREARKVDADHDYVKSAQTQS